MKQSWRRFAVVITFLALCFFLDSRSPKSVSYAYIGPGAGFVFIGSFLSVIAGFFLSVASLLLWPFRVLRAIIRRRHGFRNARVRKLIFLGLDGLDHRLTQRYLAEGKLPNLARLQQQG